MTKQYEIEDAQKNGWSRWIYPKKTGFNMACCDCGLVHILRFKLVDRPPGKAIFMQVKHNNRATAQIRRGIRQRSAK